MKKSAVLLITIIFAIIFAFSLSACGERLTKEETIPAVLGEHEGLWLYCGNTRSRTDGTESETLMKSVNIDGAEYDLDGYYILSYRYLTTANKVFYVLSKKEAETEADSFLYVFDYKNKTGKYVCELADRRTKIEPDEENKTVYISNDTEKLLYDYDGNLLYKMHDDVPNDAAYSYTLSDYSNGVFYTAYRLTQWERVENYYNNIVTYWVEWWKDGKVHSVEVSDFTFSHETTVTKTHLYFILSDVITSFNLETEAVVNYDMKPVEYSDKIYISAARYIKYIYYADDEAYVFSLAYFNKNEEDYDCKYYLHKITDDGLKLIDEFGMIGNYGYDIGEYNGSLYFRLCTGGRGGKKYYQYYRYDMQNGKLSRITKNSYHSGGSSNSSAAERRIKQVGEYKFYVTSVGYGYSGFLNGYEGYCYYLCREYDGEEEILQYSYDNYYFFDDICEF